MEGKKVKDINNQVRGLSEDDLDSVTGGSELMMLQQGFAIKLSPGEYNKLKAAGLEAESYVALPGQHASGGNGTIFTFKDKSTGESYSLESEGFRDKISKILNS